MKKKTIALLLVLMLVFGVTCGGTIAYLTSTTDTITNTFTVGNVKITMNESKVDVYGVPQKALYEGEKITGYAKAEEGDTVARITDGNSYKLIPGHTYTKDPVIYVDATSENCWVFVKVENNISKYEGTNNIAAQIEANDWTKLTGVDGVDNVYYQEYKQGQSDVNLEVFEEVNIADTANKVEGWSSITADTSKIIVTGYAIQMDGFEDDIPGAWAAVNQ